MLRAWFDRVIAGRIRFHNALTAQHAGRLAGQFSIAKTEAPPRTGAQPMRIHFWTPYAWPSTAIHVGRILPHLRTQIGALGLPWQVTDGPNLPCESVDWLLCLKAVPPPRSGSQERTVLLLNDDADRVWSRLARFDHVMVVSSPALASLVGLAHPRVWFVEETEATDVIALGGQALDRVPPSRRPPILLWHGTRKSLDGLHPLRDALDAFARETAVELSILADREDGTEQWGRLRVRFIAWSAERLAAAAAGARLALAPARPTLADSYLKSAGRIRCMYALGCPAIGDARSPDVVAFSEACGAPAANTADEWVAALRELWGDGDRLDRVARRGHDLVRMKYSAARTAQQWLWFFGAAASERPRAEDAPAASAV